MGAVAPLPGYNATLRRLTAAHGALQDLVGSLNDATVQVAGVVMNEW